MKRALIVTSMLMSLPVFADKAARDYMKSDVEPAVSRAETAYKTSCGCPLKITIDDKTIQSKDDLNRAKYIAGYVADGVAKYCTDAGSKKAVCRMTNLTIDKGKTAGFTFKAGTGVATTDGNSVVSWAMMTKELDK